MLLVLSDVEERLVKELLALAAAEIMFAKAKRDPAVTPHLLADLQTARNLLDRLGVKR